MAEKRMTLAFDGGINEYVDAQYLKLNEASESQNCDLNKGNLSLCKGYSVFNPAFFGTYNEDLRIELRCLYNYYNANTEYFNGELGIVLVNDLKGDNYILNQRDNTFVKILDDDAGDNSSVADFVNYQTGEKFMTIMSNIWTVVKVIEDIDISVAGIASNKMRRLKKNGSGSVASDDNSAPAGQFLELYKERLWICGGSLFNTVWFSAAFDPEDFTMPIAEGQANQHGGFIEIPTWDNGIIVGIKGLFEDVIVFKTNNIYRIYGSSPANYTVSQIADNVQGTICNKTIRSYNSGIFFATDVGIFLFNGVSIKYLSQKIQEEFKAIPRGSIDMGVSTAIIFKNKYILAIKGPDSVWDNNVIIEYDMINDTFMVKRGFEVNDFLVQNGELLFINKENKVFKYDETVNTFNTRTIDASWHTGDYTFGELDLKKSVQSLHFVAKGTGSILLSVISEKKIKTKTIALTTDFTPYKVKLKNKGKVISFKFQNVNGSDFTIKQTEVMYSI
ncbi:MAG TPA: hypothetical protein VIK72_19180 [Clostridiaceae bacterium]